MKMGVEDKELLHLSASYKFIKQSSYGHIWAYTILHGLTKICIDILASEGQNLKSLWPILPFSGV